MHSTAILHIVQFSAAAAADAVAAAYAELHAARAAGEVEFVSLTLGSTVERAVADGMLGGPIHIATPAAQQVLIAELDSMTSLDAYYAAPAHARIRRTLFSALCPRAAALYAEADANPAEAAHVYAAIETVMRPLIGRTDITFPGEVANGE